MYEVHGNIFGSKKVIYNCPKCQAELESPLTDAGQPDTCPTCGIRYTVPGVKELQDDIAAEALQKQYRIQEESDRRKEAEAKRLKAIEQKAEKQLRKSEQRLHEDERLQKTTVADRILRTAFSFGKYVSVFIVALCLLVIVGSLIALLYTLKQPAAPSFAAHGSEYINEIASHQTRGSNSQNTFSQSQSHQVGASIEQEVAALAQQYKLSELLRDTILSWIYQIPIKYQRDYLEGLSDYLYECQQSKTQIVFSDAVFWYNNEWQLRQSVYDSVLLGRQWFRWMMVYVLFVSTCALLAFMILPLLIQIERNTRILLVRE